MSELDLLLSVPSFLDLVEQYPSFTEPLPFTQLFMRGGLETADGDRIIYERITNDRRLAAVRGPEAQAYVATEPNTVVIDQGLICTAEKEILHPKRLFLRAGHGTFLRSNAQDVIVRAVKRITSRLLRTREYVCATLLAAGTVSLNPSNTAFPATANTVVNTVSIAGSLQTLAATAKWNVASTLMLSGDPATVNQLPKMAQTLEDNGFEPGMLIVNRGVAAGVSGNLEAQTWLVNNGGQTIDMVRAMSRVNASRQGQPGRRDPWEPHAFSGLGDIPTWLVWDHHYLNRSSAVTRYLGTGIGILLPSDLDGVLGFAEGPVFVPQGQQVIGDAEQAASLFAVRQGIQLYAYRTVDDTGNIIIVGRDTFVPMVRNNLGILNLTNLA